MAEEKKLDMKELYKKLSTPPQVLDTFSTATTKVELIDNGSFVYYQKDEKIIAAHSTANVADGRRIDTRTAARVSTSAEDASDVFGTGKKVTNVFTENGLTLTQTIMLYEDADHLTVQVALHDETKETETNYLAPFETIYPDWSYKPLFLSLDQKMLSVPYDNDMWTRYDSVTPRPGRKSYDVTAIYDEHTNEGLVIGAVDFDTWKNAIAWSRFDARCTVAYSGCADEGTHDTMPHGTIIGKSVSSARFIVKWTEDIHNGMVEFGKLCTKVTPAREWHGKTPFGWNAYSGLGRLFTLKHWEEAADYMYEELPEFGDEDHVVYINIDGAAGLDEEELKRIVKKLHDRGQKAGWYCGPCLSHRAFGKYMTIKGTDTPLSEIYLKDKMGRVIPAMDSAVPLDVTHPLWEVHARNTIANLLSLDVDYIKIDFLSHASVEGDFYDKSIRTGRQAINKAYHILSDAINESPKEIFVDLSIAPVFPYFLGHARRSCCDTFGHFDDTRYALNALNFGWWAAGTIYRFGDPDHCTMYHSMIDGRPVTTEIEAKSRLNCAVISGTVLLLSENFGPTGDEANIAGARDRVKRLVNNKALMDIARIGLPFVPLYFKDGTTPFYTLQHGGRSYAAIFNYEGSEQTISMNPAEAGLPAAGTAVSANDGSEVKYDGALTVTLDAYDSVIFELK